MIKHKKKLFVQHSMHFMSICIVNSFFLSCQEDAREMDCKSLSLNMLN